MRVAKYAKISRERQGDAVVKVRVVGSAAEARLSPATSPFNSIIETRQLRVNICQNIWSLLRGVGANFVRERGGKIVGGWLEKGLSG